MTTAQQVVDAARSEVGYVEAPANSNCNKFAVEAHLKNCTYWCAAYTSAILIRTGADVPPGVLTLSTRLNMAAWQKAGRWVQPADVQAGDILFYHLTGRNGASHSIPDHTGIATDRPGGGRQPAVEGNTSSDDHGSQDDGGCVGEKHRSTSVVIGAGRPNFSVAPPPLPTPPTLEEDDMDFMVVQMNDAGQQIPGSPILLLSSVEYTEVTADNEYDQLKKVVGAPRQTFPAALAMLLRSRTHHSR